MKDNLKLDYLPDDWQVELILRVLEGYDSILTAGTGCGKSLIFEGLAVMGTRVVPKYKIPLVVVICPRKALEYDQVCPSALALGSIALILFTRQSKERTKVYALS